MSHLASTCSGTLLCRHHYMHPRFPAGRKMLSSFETLVPAALLVQACVLESGKCAWGHACMFEAAVNTSFISHPVLVSKGAIVDAFPESSDQFRHMNFSGVCL